MALTVRELISQTQEKYQLKLLTGEDSLDFVVTWVHMTEDTSVAEFFWGNEIVVTSGYAAKNEAGLLRFIDVLLERRSAGIVINVGQYINEVPPAVIAYCQEKQLPLLTMPWDMFITEFVRECCSLINKSSRDEEDLSKAVIHAIVSPQEANSYRSQLEEFFQEEKGFQMIAIRIEFTGPSRSILDQRSILRLHTALGHFDFPYLIFRYERRFIILLNQTDRSVADAAAQRILETIHEIFARLPIQIGIGEPVNSFDQLVNGFHSAVSASRRAALQKLDVVRFQDMGFYKLLYSIPDDSLLLSYYHEVMDPLLEHDHQYGSVYTETLFRYLLTDGSLQAVASAMYTHRNTVNYRMGKIRELLGQPLETQSERLPYLLAYHIAVVLRLSEDYEA